MTTRNIIDAPIKYVNGLDLSVSAHSTKLVNMESGRARDSSNVNDIILESPVVINGATTGLNGSDVAPIVASKLYSVYLVGDSTKYQQPGGLLSLDFNKPALPSGYDMFRRVGMVRVDGSVFTTPFKSYGASTIRTVYYDEEFTMVSSAATAPTNAALTTTVPPQKGRALIRVSFEAANMGDAVNISAFGASSSPSNVIIGSVAASPAISIGTVTCPYDMNGDDPTITYFVSDMSDDISLSVIGYEDVLL